MMMMINKNNDGGGDGWSQCLTCILVVDNFISDLKTVVLLRSLVAIKHVMVSPKHLEEINICFLVPEL